MKQDIFIFVSTLYGQLGCRWSADASGKHLETRPYFLVRPIVKKHPYDLHTSKYTRNRTRYTYNMIPAVSYTGTYTGEELPDLRFSTSPTPRFDFIASTENDTAPSYTRLPEHTDSLLSWNTPREC